VRLRSSERNRKLISPEAETIIETVGIRRRTFFHGSSATVICRERDAQRGSIKGPITIPQSNFDYLTVLSMPQVSFEFL